jgi:hypothetical protein
VFVAGRNFSMVQVCTCHLSCHICRVTYLMSHPSCAHL